LLIAYIESSNRFQKTCQQNKKKTAKNKTGS